jgi:hypothetical protein
MEDQKIDQIAREVLVSLKKARTENVAPTPSASGPHLHAPADAEPKHPSLHLMSVAGGVVGSPCIIEPDKVCVGSLRCRSFGH